MPDRQHHPNLSIALPSTVQHLRRRESLGLLKTIQSTGSSGELTASQNRTKHGKDGKETWITKQFGMHLCFRLAVHFLHPSPSSTCNQIAFPSFPSRHDPRTRCSQHDWPLASSDSRALRNKINHTEKQK